MPRTLTKITIISFLAVLLVLGSLGATPSERNLPLEQTTAFPVGALMGLRVQFWVDIYYKYYSWQAVLHDREYPFVVYGVADSADKEKRPPFAKTLAIQKSAQKILQKLHSHRDAIGKGNFKLSLEEQRIFDLFKEVPGDKKFLEAAAPKRFHRQGGLRDQLEKALFLAGRYLPRMKGVFRAEGLPEDIAYLPFVESSFDKKAVSKVGASGIWQFMPETGREFLHVNTVVDERNDPMRSAEAAAKLLRQNFESLKSWPLALTAYNHGRLGMMRAVKSVGDTSLERIIAEYKGAGFGFASANFYASFIAAQHVAKNFPHYLGQLAQAKILEFDEFVMPDFVDIQVLAEHILVSMEDLRELNPALSPDVWMSKLLVPVGYVLRVPLSARDNFLARYDSIPSAQKFPKQNELPAAAAVASRP